MHERACQNLIYFYTWEYMKMLMYNGKSLKKGNLKVHHKWCYWHTAESENTESKSAPQLMQKVISNSKLFKYENTFCQILYETLECNSSHYNPC
jgi:hypothetical protein